MTPSLVSFCANAGPTPGSRVTGASSPTGADRGWLCGSWAAGAATGGSAGGHEGLLRGRCVLRREGERTDHLVFRPRWFGAGEVTTPGGDVLTWKRGDFLGRRWRLLDRDGHVQIEMVRRPAFFKTSVLVAVSDAGRRWAELPELVLLGFFLLRMLERQSQAAH